MTGLFTWRKGDTFYPGQAVYDGLGNPVAAVSVSQLLAVFKTDSGTELAKFSKVEAEGYTLANQTSEVVDAGAAAVDVFRFPITEEMTANWPTAGKVRLVVQVQLTSEVFENGYRKTFDEDIAVLKAGFDD